MRLRTIKATLVATLGKQLCARADAFVIDGLLLAWRKNSPARG